jgi:Pyruvate/2-oxoacid:ferredoxin oxidoreductase delta subunit
MFALVSSYLMAALILAAIGLWLLGERGSLLLPSTVKCVKAIGWRNVLNLKVVHAYVYGRWSNQYIDILINWVFPRLSEEGKKYWADHYHGKVLTKDHAKAIVTLEKPIPLQDLEQVLPYATARDLILDAPPEIAVYECPCRHASANPCEPTQVCLIFGAPFVECLLEHNPHSARRISQTEALVILKEEHERGHLHSAWFKDVMLNRFFAICNCCKCCCGGVQGMTKFGIPMMASSGFVARIAEEFCIACGNCVEACPFSALSLNGRAASVEWDKCMGCGVCVGKCSQGAISSVRDEKKGEPMDARVLQ